MIKLSRLFFIIGVIVLCSGCSKEDNKPSVPNTSDDISQQESTQQETIYENTDNYFKESDIIQDYNPNQTIYSTNIITTVQNNLMYSTVAAFDANGKYKCMLYVADIKTGVQMPLCSKVDCNHNNDKCNAYLGDNITIGNMTYIDEIIYIFGSRKQDINGQKTDNYFLMRISSDGSIREDLGTVLTVYGNSSEGTINMSKDNVLIHRGYLYYILTEMENEKIIDNVVQYGKTTGKLYRYNINGKSEPECIYEYTIEEDGTLGIILAAQGEYIYVVTSYAFWDYSAEITKLSEFKYEECKININTLEKEQTASGENYCKNLVKDSISYNNNYNWTGNTVTMELNETLEYEEQLKTMKISFYNKETGEIKYLTERYLEENEYFEPGSFWITDKYICINTMLYDGEGLEATYVFDLDWNLITKLDKKIDHCFGEYILWHDGSGGEKDYYIGELEGYINENEKCGRIYKLVDKPQGTTVDMNRYIYED